MTLPFTTMAVFGGRGQMGALFVDRGRALGLEVQVYDQPLDHPRIACELPQADLVLLAVPVTALDEVLTAITPRMAEGCVLTDVCSVKVAPMHAMQKAYDGPVVGTHPLFGATPPPEPRVALVPGEREDDAAAVHKVTALFEAMGFPCFPTTAGEHDHAMAAIQNLNFVTTVAYLAALSTDESLRPFLTPSFERRLQASKKMLVQDSNLFATLFDANPYSMDLVRTYRNYLHVAAGGDMDLLIQRAQGWWPHDPQETP